MCSSTNLQAQRPLYYAWEYRLANVRGVTPCQAPVSAESGRNIAAESESYRGRRAGKEAADCAHISHKR